MPPAPPQGQQSDNHMAPLWLVVGLFVAILLIWYFFRRPIIEGFLYVKLIEINFIDLIISSPNLRLARQIILTADPMSISTQQMVFIANTVGNFFAIPVAGILLFFAIFLFRK